MELKKLTVELRYEGSGAPFNWTHKLFRNLTGKEPTVNNPPLLDNILGITFGKKDARLLIERQRWAMDIFTTDNVDETSKFAKSIFEKVDSNIEWGQGIRIGIRTLWIRKFDDTLEKLISRLKEKLYTPNQLTDNSLDISLNLTLADGSNQINYIAGVMDKKQLLAWYFENSLENLDKKNPKKRQLPDTSLVVDIDYYYNGKASFTRKYFSSFLNSAINYGNEQANKTKQLIL